MRDENLEMVQANMFLPEDQQKKLTEKQKMLVTQVSDIYNQQLQHPMKSRAQLRDYLIKRYGVSKTQAYTIILYSSVLLGNVKASHKNWVRQKIEFLSEQAYIAADAGNYKKAESLTKIAGVLAKAFATNIDEGELIDAQKYLEIDQVRITTDPAALNIKVSETKQKEIDKLLKKYEIEDAEVINENNEEEEK